MLWHFSWAAIVIGALMLNVVWPISPGWSVWALSLIAYPAGAAVILVNRPGNRVGRVLAVVGVAAGLIFVGSWVVWTWQDAVWSPYLEAVSGTAVPVLFWGVITLLYVFPDGEIGRRSFRVVHRTFTCVVALMACLAAFVPGPFPLTGRMNPMGAAEWVGQAYEAGITILVPGLLVGGWAAVARFRSASTDVRLQLRWFMLGVVAVAALILVIGFIPETLPSPWEELTNFVVVVGFWSLPMAIVVAITRYRLYEIDRIVSRTITYALVVGLLGATYFGSVTVVTSVLPTQDNLIVAVSTLLVAALFNPLRARLQVAVDRRFNRLAYRTATIADRFAGELREPLTSDELVHRWCATVEEVLQPALVGVWLAPGAAPSRR